MATKISKINIDSKDIPLQSYFLNGKEYVGEVAFIDGFNGHTKTDTDGIMCALIKKSCFNNAGKANILKDQNGNTYHSENRRRQVYTVGQPAQVEPTPGIDRRMSGLYRGNKLIATLDMYDGNYSVEGDELVRRYNAFPGMLEALKEAQVALKKLDKKDKTYTAEGALDIINAAIQSATK